MEEVVEPRVVVVVDPCCNNAGELVFFLHTSQAAHLAGPDDVMCILQDISCMHCIVVRVLVVPRGHSHPEVVEYCFVNPEVLAEAVS